MDQSACCTRKSSRGMANRCGTIFLLHKALHDPLCTSFTRPTFTCKTSINGVFHCRRVTVRCLWCVPLLCGSGCRWFILNKPLSPKLRIQHLRSPGVEIVHVVSVSHVPVALAVRSPRARHPARSQQLSLGRRGGAAGVEIWGAPAGLGRRAVGGCGWNPGMRGK